QGKFRGQLRTYICQEGKLDLNNFQNSASTDVVKLTKDDIYTISIKARGNKIETYIKPESGPDAGTEFPLDVFIDEKNQYFYGNIGFCSVDGEEMLIDDVGIKPIEKPEEKS